MYTAPSQDDEPPKAVPLSLSPYAPWYSHFCDRATLGHFYGSPSIKVSAESVRPSTRQKVLKVQPSPTSASFLLTLTTTIGCYLQSSVGP